ncbi:hypothetical protein CABS03_04490 [Colletotrichum abscissum]
MKLEPPRRSVRDEDLGISAVDLAGASATSRYRRPLFLRRRLVDGSRHSPPPAYLPLTCQICTIIPDHSRRVPWIRFSGDGKGCQTQSNSETTGKGRPIFLASLSRRNMTFSTSTCPRPASWLVVVVVVVVVVGIHDNLRDTGAQQPCRPRSPMAKYDSCMNQPVRCGSLSLIPIRTSCGDGGEEV